LKQYKGSNSKRDIPNPKKDLKNPPGLFSACKQSEITGAFIPALDLSPLIGYFK
jgi:hypothetical protein